MPADFFIPAFNIPTINIDDRPHSHKRARYTPDLLPDTISVASENYVGNLTTPYDFLRLLLLPSNYTNHPHEIKKDYPHHGRAKEVYCSRKHNAKICYKKTRFYCSK